MLYAVYIYTATIADTYFKNCVPQVSLEQFVGGYRHIFVLSAVSHACIIEKNYDHTEEKLPYLYTSIIIVPSIPYSTLDKIVCPLWMFGC